jgi:hypothetical protein
MTRPFITTDTDSTDGFMSERWAQPVLENANPESGSDLEHLHNPTRADVEPRLEQTHGVIYFGHGTVDTIGEPALVDLANVSRASGTILAVACRSAASLGEAAIAADADTYVGFVDDLPVIDAAEIDSLMHERLTALVLGDESCAHFEERFRAECQRIQDKHYGRGRDPASFTIAQTAQILKHTLRVLNRESEPRETT